MWGQLDPDFDPDDSDYDGTWYEDAGATIRNLKNSGWRCCK